MYGLPQAGKFANDYLKQLLQPQGFIPTAVPGLWTATDLVFALSVDDFVGTLHTQYTLTATAGGATDAIQSDG
jgi:hypothetical protein